MSIPSSFSNADSYFHAVLEFLDSYSWIYREANTCCITSLEAMPLEFKNYFLRISNDNLNSFPFVHGDIEDCPPLVMNFRQKLRKLTPKTLNHLRQTVAKKTKNNKGVSHKKMHEVHLLAAHIFNHCRNSQLLVDLGAGLGYLSQALLELNPEYLIVGLEAAEDRVEKARQRCIQHLPPAAPSSIAYHQHFIDGDSSSYIESQASELARKNNCQDLQKMSIIGLHACADLSVTAMKLFLEIPRVRCLHIMPCCYHKLELQSSSPEASDSHLFVNFPLSCVLRRCVETSSQKPILNRPFLRLACQQTKSHWGLEYTEKKHADHGYQMYIRALAEALRQPKETVKPIRSAASSSTNPITFSEVKRLYQLESNESGLNVDWQDSHEKTFLQLSEEFPDNQGPRLAEALTCLQAALQNLCENLVLLDRLCFLEDESVKQSIPLSARYESIFDDKVSSRCHVLIAEKLS
ncbi:hypothetical protein KR074_003873 [Drosophila pseudoananassae]|nr:hypothetical protein KR074_003873 [Drosophila pseudoananassae]